MENFIEKTLFRSRWVLAPLYLGLSLAVVALTIKFFEELFHLLVGITHYTEAQMILRILSLVDLAMVGGLLIMVMMSGYENFVSRLNVESEDEKLGWLGTMDSSSLKAKIAASIVAISSIHLLKMFMEIETKDETHLMWYVIMHLTFVVSAFLMGFLDSLVKKK